MQLKADVTAELSRDPAIDAAGIGVMVKDDVVTLAGHLDSFLEKHAVGRAAHRVAALYGIALELDVKLAADHMRSDSEIAQSAATALRLNSLVSGGKVHVEAEDGWVTIGIQFFGGLEKLSHNQIIVMRSYSESQHRVCPQSPVKILISSPD